MEMEIVTGSVAGTGAAINVSCGFRPRYVKVFNPNDAGSLFPTMEWFKGMAAASGFKTKAVADSGATGNKSSDYVTANGISEYSGGGVASEGFTIGADADINVNGETIFWLALR
jgi:hypothetical protein